MYQRLLVEQRKRPLRCPRIERAPIHASLVEVEVGPRLALALLPVECHHRQIWLTHERLADIVDAVVCMAAQVRDADIVFVMPQDLSQHFQAMKVVVGAQLAVVPAAIAQLEGGAIHLAHLFHREADIVVLEETAPGRFSLGTRLAGIQGAQAETPIKGRFVIFDGFPCRRCTKQVLASLSLRSMGIGVLVLTIRQKWIRT